jgi:hypothetical protein
MKLRLILFALACLGILINLYAEEPLRVGLDVAEPKLLKRVDISYAEAMGIPTFFDGPVVLDILIDEHGTVRDLKQKLFIRSGLEIAKSAVSQWHFSPTLVKGKGVSLTATVAVIFSVGFNPNTVDLGINGELVPAFSTNMRDLCFIPATMDSLGNLREQSRPLQGQNADMFCRNFRDYEIIPEPDVPFSAIENVMKGQKSPSVYRLKATQYRYVDSTNLPWIKRLRPGLEGLYYSTLLVSNASQLVELAGADPKVIPPIIDFNHNQLAGFLDVSRYKDGAIFFCTIFIDENGIVNGVSGGAVLDKPQALFDAVSQLHVTTPGMRNGVPVPTAVILAIPVR